MQPLYSFEFLGQDQMVEQQSPNQIDPPQDTEGEDNDDEHQEVDDATLLEELLAADEQLD